MRYRLGGAISVGFAIGALLLGSCTAPPPEGPATSAGSTVTASKPYGSLTVAGKFDVAQLDPVVNTATFNNVAGAIFDSLYYYDPNNQLKPGIAERWEISQDGLAHTFSIRKGVKFHDGSDLTGADVKFSIERQLAPDGTQIDAPAWRAAIASVDLKDDYTVVLRMKSPQFELLGGVGAEGMTSVLPKSYIQVKGIEPFRSSLVGSGPWKVVSYNTGVRLELQALESHWRAVPKFKNITVLNILEEGTKVAMLKTGELDMAAVAPDSVPGLKSAGLRVLSYDGGTQVFGSVLYDVENPDKFALGDVRVRKALQLALNSREIADKILNGNGAPYALFQVSPNAYFFDPNVLKPDPYDPEGAKKLLAEAGYASGFSTKINDLWTGNVVSTINQAVSGYWRKIGVNADVVPIERAAFLPMMYARHPNIWNSFNVQPGTAPLHFEKMALGYHSQKNFAKNIKNLKLDELIDKVPQTTDPAERKRVALQAAVMAKDEHTALTIVGMYLNIAVSSKIGDVARYPGPDIMKYMYETITHAK